MQNFRPWHGASVQNSLAWEGLIISNDLGFTDLRSEYALFVYILYYI